MTRLLKKCTQCHGYTLNPNTCPICEGSVVNAHPPRFSIEDRYGRYRRAMKKDIASQHENNAADHATP